MKIEIELTEEQLNKIYADRIVKICDDNNRKEVDIKDILSKKETKQFDFIEKLGENINIYFSKNQCFYITKKEFGIRNEVSDICKSYIATFVKKKGSELKVGDVFASYINITKYKYDHNDFMYIIDINNNEITYQYISRINDRIVLGSCLREFNLDSYYWCLKNDGF